MLIDENWRSIDPYEVLRENEMSRETMLKQDGSNRSNSQVDSKQSTLTALQFEDLERQSKPKVKRPIKHDMLDEMLVNINKANAPSH